MYRQTRGVDVHVVSRTEGPLGTTKFGKIPETGQLIEVFGSRLRVLGSIEDDAKRTAVVYVRFEA